MKRLKNQKENLRQRINRNFRKQLQPPRDGDPERGVGLSEQRSGDGAGSGAPPASQ